MIVSIISYLLVTSVCVIINQTFQKVKARLFTSHLQAYTSFPVTSSHYLGPEKIWITNLDPIHFYVTFHGTDKYIP